MQLSDIIAFNYPIFSESEYISLSRAVGFLKSAAIALSTRFSGNRTGADRLWNDAGYSYGDACGEIGELCDIVTELCRKAQFLFLENALTENVNLEVNQDKYVVESFLEKFGFSAPLVTALNEAEKLYSTGATELELKSCMGHLRSFLENLHTEAIPAIHRKKGNSAPVDDKWGSGLTFLRVTDFLSQPEEKLISGLYAVISDEAVHPLIAKREYARLSRNWIIEYALLFLRKLEQLGVPRAPDRN